MPPPPPKKAQFNGLKVEAPRKITWTHRRESLHLTFRYTTFRYTTRRGLDAERCENVMSARTTQLLDHAFGLEFHQLLLVKTDKIAPDLSIVLS